MYQYWMKYTKMNGCVRVKRMMSFPVNKSLK
uniref:Uncharacterized protein n=1 Tax=Arundo donax TaxID=35708 RepID=A0A0A9EVP6_ARUDO